MIDWTQGPRRTAVIALMGTALLGCDGPTERAEGLVLRTDAASLDAVGTAASANDAVFQFEARVTIENRTTATVSLPTCGFNLRWGIERVDGGPSAFSNGGSCAETPALELPAGATTSDTLLIVGSASQSGLVWTPDPSGSYQLIVEGPGGPLRSNSFTVRAPRTVPCDPPVCGTVGSGLVLPR